MSRMVGGTLGVAVLGTFIGQTSSRADFVDSLGHGLLIGGVRRRRWARSWPGRSSRPSSRAARSSRRRRRRGGRAARGGRARAGGAGDASRARRRAADATCRRLVECRRSKRDGHLRRSSCVRRGRRRGCIARCVPLDAATTGDARLAAAAPPARGAEHAAADRAAERRELDRRRQLRLDVRRPRRTGRHRHRYRAAVARLPGGRPAPDARPARRGGPGLRLRGDEQRRCPIASACR